MKTTIDTDLAIDASEEAKICLSCDKKRCTPVHCDRLKDFKAKGEKENEKG